MSKLLDVLIIVFFREKWLSYSEYGRTLAASCQREEAQRMKQAWQDHIEAAAAAFDDARSVADAPSGRNFLEPLEWQVPLAFAGYEIDSDDHWISEDEVRSLH